MIVVIRQKYKFWVFHRKQPNGSVWQCKIVSLFQNPVGKVPPPHNFCVKKNKLTVLLCPTPHTLTQHTSHGGHWVFIDSILQDKNPCDRCDINCDRRDINDKVNNMDLYFQTVSILGWGCWITWLKSISFFTKYYEFVTGTWNLRDCAIQHSDWHLSWCTPATGTLRASLFNTMTTILAVRTFAATACCSDFHPIWTY